MLVPDKSGSYSLVPKINNPNAEAKSLSLYQPEEWADIEHNFR
ncbi:transcription elongation factor GreAB [Lacticaseibacillus paracasei]|nr:transcription elongation factor GreAB [Lacticaseibacillus paracasei]MCT4386135.1 transcription elongation factor GreAB [Lacticaseibacillus paracasei]